MFVEYKLLLIFRHLELLLRRRGEGASFTSPGSHLPKQTTKEKTDGFPLLPLRGAVCGDAKWTFLITKNKKRWNPTWCRVPRQPQPLDGSMQTTADTQVRFLHLSLPYSSPPLPTFGKKPKSHQQQMKKGNVLNCGICGLDRAARLMATSWCMSWEESYCSSHISFIS